MFEHSMWWLCVQRFISLRRLRKRVDDGQLVIGKGNAQIFSINAAGMPGGGGRAQSEADASTSGVRNLLSGGGGGRGSTVAGNTRRGRASAAPSKAGGSSTGMRPIVGAATSSTAAAYTVAARQMNQDEENANNVRLLQMLSRGDTATRRPLDALVLPTRSSLTYLDGSLPGDYGFDPLGLFSPENNAGFLTQNWLRYSEIIHARFAMLGAVGCLAPEVLAKEEVIPEETGVLWFRTGFLPVVGQDYDFGIDLVQLFYIQSAMMAFAEVRRLQDFKEPGSLESQYFFGLEKYLTSKSTGDPAYPGGPIFNFFDLVRDTSSSLNYFKEAELVNGRLAMVATVGIAVQAIVTGDGPYQNLLNHLDDPLGQNVLAQVVEEEQVTEQWDF
mmetsp:Transcript_17354/g.37450  ORF Transcript_17354/g.37450 Transcript_17354/m.37450 type:complete len:386 (+) Transcript_17354:1269-2426(+)